jgi:HEAT repeat protein
MTSPRALFGFLLLLIASSLSGQTGDEPKTKKGVPLPPDGLKALTHPDAGVRYRAAETLAHLGPLAKFALPELRELLKDKNAFVRIKAVEAIWKIDSKTNAKSLVPVLQQAMTDANPRVRAATPPVIALFGAKAKPALPALLEALQDKDADVKLAAIIAVGDLGPVARDGAEFLLALTRDKDFFLLEPFVGASLASLGAGIIPELSKALAAKAPERRRVAAYALGSMGPVAAAAAADLAVALQTKDASTRRQVAWALGKIGKDAGKALPQLEAVLTDNDASVRIEAALATWLISGDAKHVGVLIAALQNPSVQVRNVACQTLAQMKASAKAAVEPVAKLLQDKELRLRAVMTLGEIGPEATAVLPALRTLLKDKDGETRLWSAFAVWQITRASKEALPILERGLEEQGDDKLAIRLLGDMREAAQSVLPTLVELYREEEETAYRLLLADAIKKIDAKVAVKLGIR